MEDRRIDTALVAHSPASLLRDPDVVRDPVLGVVLERARAGTRPGERDDPHLVALAVEGGGMRGAVSSGMCVLLEAAGLTNAFDRIYGVSAGALNGWATAAGQAALSATHYEDAALHGVINHMRPLAGRPVVDFDLMFEELIGVRKPLAHAPGGPDFRAIALSLDTMAARVLRDFSSAAEVRDAVRASASLPRLGGAPPVFRGERMADGGLVEPIPYRTAIDEGATHVLVLRTRPAGFRRPAALERAEHMSLRADPRLAELVRSRIGAYNNEARDLERGLPDDDRAHVQQVTVPDRTRLIGRLDPSRERVVEAVRLGAQAMAECVLTGRVDLCWQPVVYRDAAPEPEPVPQRSGSRPWRLRPRRAAARPGVA